MTFADREDAGERLASALHEYKGKECVVYAIPRGGVILGSVAAKALDCPLDLVITRKIGHPSNPEYAIAVVAEDGHEVFNEAEIRSVDPNWLGVEKQKQRDEARRRRLAYIGNNIRPSVEGKIAIVIDDGIATGMSLLAALKEVRELHPARLVAAIPVMPAEFLDELKTACDEVVCLNVDEYYQGSVGAYYGSFSQVEDEEVVRLMKQ